MNLISWVVLLSGITALSLNVLLIPIILKYSSPQIGGYKYLLLLYTVNAILYTIFQILSSPTYHLFSLGYFVYSSVIHIPRAFGVIGLVAFSSCFAQNLVICSLSFLYRYGCLCRPEVLEWFQPSWKLLSIVIGYIVVVSIATFELVTITPFWTGNDPLLIDMVLNETGIDLGEMPYFAGFVHYPSGGLNFTLLAAMCYFSVIVNCLVGIGSFSFYRIICTIRGVPKTSETNTIHHLHKRLIILLALQAAFPLTFTGGPLVGVFICAFFGVESENIPDYIGSVMSFAQICDPILVICFVACYRNNVVRLFRRIVPKSSIAADTTIAAATSTMVAD